MYTVLWSDSNGNDRWCRCDGKEEVKQVIIANNLQDDADVLIFPPDADDLTIEVEDILNTNE